MEREFRIMSYSRNRLNEVVALQKAVLERIETDLSEFGNLRRLKYIQEFHDEFETYEAVCSADEILTAASASRLVWIGDYHALARSRAFAVDFLQQLVGRKGNVAIGVEVVFARDQRILDRWLGGAVSETEFLERIQYREQWGCDWPSYRTLFQTARELKIPVYGVDRHHRRDMRSIGRRDQGVAHRIAHLIERDPDRTLVVLFGESHLASAHLPQRVRRLLGKSGLVLNDVLILQNLDALHWEIQRRNPEGARAVRIRPREFCVFNTTPVEKYESFRQYLVRCADGEEGAADWTRFVHTVIDAIFDFLEIDKQAGFMDYLPKVYSEISPEQLPAFLARQEIPASQVRLALDAIQEYGTSYVPELNSMFIDDFRLDYTIEEATRFVHQLCRGEFHNSAERARSDLFFLAVIERAFGFFFSRLLDSSRDGVEPLGERVLQYIGYNRQLARTVEQLLDPDARPSTKHFERLRTTVAASPAGFKRLHLLSQVLGYALGRKLYKAYLESRISRKEIQALLQDPLEAPDRPLECYALLSTQLT